MKEQKNNAKWAQKRDQNPSKSRKKKKSYHVTQCTLWVSCNSPFQCYNLCATSEGFLAFCDCASQLYIWQKLHTIYRIRYPERLEFAIVTAYTVHYILIRVAKLIELPLRGLARIIRNTTRDMMETCHPFESRMSQTTLPRDVHDMLS